MKTCYFYKKGSNKLFLVLTGTTTHECWKELMEKVGLRNLTLAKTKYDVFDVPKPSKKAKPDKPLLVNLKSFTEMFLGVYEVTERSYGYSLTLKDGRKLKFDKTGKQIVDDPKKERFANRIEWKNFL